MIFQWTRNLMGFFTTHFGVILLPSLSSNCTWQLISVCPNIPQTLSLDITQKLYIVIEAFQSVLNKDKCYVCPILNDFIHYKVDKDMDLCQATMQDRFGQESNVHSEVKGIQFHGNRSHDYLPFSSEGLSVHVQTFHKIFLSISISVYIMFSWKSWTSFSTKQMDGMLLNQSTHWCKANKKVTNRMTDNDWAHTIWYCDNVFLLLVIIQLVR